LDTLPTERVIGSGLSRDAVIALAKARLSAPPAPTVKTARPGGLTKREYQVARLIAQGRTNREIAEELGMTVRTAESHVQNVADKLDAHGEGRPGRVLKIRAWFEENRPR
jgi:DNA-binding NarL/FixJ family response regulator